MLKLIPRTRTTVPIEAEVITPDTLGSLDATAVAHQTVYHGNRKEALGEFFKVEGRADDGLILIEGDVSHVKWIGAGMTKGTIIVDGNVGMHLGAEMRGGRIEVRGNVGDWCGAEMRGGLIEVHGDAGHLLGAAYRGSARGMRGGTIVVHGRAGNEVGSTMRRGLIVVRGEVADFCGVSMIAGTIVLGAQPGLRTGAGMKRGTILLVPPEPPNTLPELLPTFRFAARFQPVFVRVLAEHLTNLGFPFPEPAKAANYLRFSGDLAEKGLGEILIWSP